MVPLHKVRESFKTWYCEKKLLINFNIITRNYCLNKTTFCCSVSFVRQNILFILTHSNAIKHVKLQCIITRQHNWHLVCLLSCTYTVMILSFRTDRSGQTVQTQIRLLRVSTLYTVCYSVYIIWAHFSVVKPCCSNIRMITANEPPNDKTNKMTMRPAKTDQPGHSPSLIRVFALCSRVAKDLSFLHADSEDSDQT